MGPMAEGYELICQAVALDLCQIGDSKGIWGVATRAAVAEAGCPSGCLQEGSQLPCAYTWEYAQLWCRGVEVVQARAEWAAVMKSALREVGPNREHKQLQVALLALSVEDSGQAEFAGAAAEAQMRRFVCGFIEEDEARFGGGTKVRKCCGRCGKAGLRCSGQLRVRPSSWSRTLWSTASSGRRFAGWRIGGWRLRGGRALRRSDSCRRSGWRATGCGRVCC